MKRSKLFSSLLPLLVTLAPPFTTSAGAQSVPDSAAIDNLEQVKALFEPRGWRVERDADGYLSLYPPATGLTTSEPEAEPKEQAKPPTQTSDNAVVQHGDHARLIEELSKHGWRARTEEDGSILLHPPGDGETPTAEEPSDASPSHPRPLRGERMEPHGTLELPVDSWKEAHQLAERWLERHGDEGLVVGRVRRIKRIYLISIVADSHPHHLFAQLLVRADDGEVLRVS